MLEYRPSYGLTSLRSAECLTIEMKECPFEEKYKTNPLFNTYRPSIFYILTYLFHEILEVVGKMVDSQKKGTITPKFIQKAIDGDDELKVIWVIIMNHA